MFLNSINNMFWILIYLIRFILFSSIGYFVQRLLLFKIINNKIQMVKNSLFFSYLIVLISITGLPDMDLNFKLVNEMGMLNLIPFINIDGIQAFFNVLLFFPLGFLLPIVFNKAEWSTTIILIMAISLTLFVEILQLFGGRCFDVDDIIMNTIGAIIGYSIINFWHSCSNNEANSKLPLKTIR